MGARPCTAETKSGMATDRFKCRMGMKMFRWYFQCISFCTSYSILISVFLGSPPTNADECVS